jgi:hypothetical protein
MADGQTGGDRAAWLLDRADDDDAADSRLLPTSLARASFDDDDALALAFALTGPVGVTGLAPIKARAPSKAAADDEEVGSLVPWKRELARRAKPARDARASLASCAAARALSLPRALPRSIDPGPIV